MTTSGHSPVAPSPGLRRSAASAATPFNATVTRPRHVVKPGTTPAADPASRTAMLGALRGRPWLLPARDAAAEVRDFANAPGLRATLFSTTGSTAPAGLSDIRVPVRIGFGTRDLMLGTLTAPRFATAIPGAQLIPLRGCGHVPMADDPDVVASTITDLTTDTSARA